ncbi:MAG: hypothetical protein J7621_09650 [Niastella sp.]|nr:hypothetical protein [Niastella sp.]
MNTRSIRAYICIGVAVVLFAACIKQTEKQFKGTAVVEFDATVLNSVTAGITYPLLSQIPGYGVPLDLSVIHASCQGTGYQFVDSFIKRSSGVVSLRVNLVGPTAREERAIGFKIIDVPVTAISFTGYKPCVKVDLNVLPAVAGTHYTLADNKIVIPADSSFGYLRINVLNAPATAGQARSIGFQLDSTQSLLPSVNYRTLAIAIDQR